MTHALLSSRTIFRLHGEDTLSFLQGLVTQDVMRLPKEGAQYALMLTPQGKFLHGFFLYWQEGAVLLDVARTRADELKKRLLMYRLRSKVEIDDTALKVVASWGDDAKGLPDARTALMGCRAVVADVPAQATSEDSYHAMRVMLGVPDDEEDMVPEKSFPLPFGFEALRAVDFHKGCYVGQEVTARSKHLGTLRKAVFCVKGHALPPRGAALRAGDVQAGEMLSSRGDHGLALLSVPQPAEVAYDGGVLSVSAPIWFKNLPSA